jgi:hypothetical protein
MVELLMKYCPSCGKAGVERMKFCPQCGQRLMSSNLEDTQRAIPKPEPTLMESSTVKTAQHGLSPILRTHGTQTYTPKSEVLLKEQNWFERHLNWTMVLAWAGSYLIVFIVAFLVALGDPNISEDAVAGMGVVIGLIVSIAVGQWVLRKKNRSLAWLLICGTWFFLLIENHSFMRDEYGRTAADYDKAIKLNPDNADAYCERGDFYYELDEYDKAISDYNKAIELAPNDAYAYYSRGIAYRKKGEASKEVSDLEKCIGLSTDRELTEAAQQALSEIKTSH